MTFRMGYDFAITGVPEKSKDFLGKRRNSEMSELSCLHGSEGYEVRSDEVKLIRAQGEGLGIKSR